jgi:hypothetical protein
LTKSFFITITCQLLQMIDGGIKLRILHQLLMRAVFRCPVSVQQHDPVDLAEDGQPVGYDDQQTV